MIHMSEGQRQLADRAIDEAAAHFTAALALVERFADLGRKREALSSLLLGETARIQEKHDRAIELNVLGIDRLDDERSETIVTAWWHLGVTYREVGREEESHRAFDRAKAIAQELARSELIQHLEDLPTRSIVAAMTRPASIADEPPPIDPPSARSSLTKEQAAEIISRAEQQKVLASLRAALAPLQGNEHLLSGQLRARAGILWGRLAFYDGSQEGALEWFGQSLSLVSDDGTREGRLIAADCLGGVAMVHRRAGTLVQAAEAFEQALNIRRSVGDQKRIAAALGNLGSIYSDLGDDEKTIEKYREAFELRGATGNSSGQILALRTLLPLYLQHGRTEQAEEGVLRLKDIWMREPLSLEDILDVFDLRIRFFFAVARLPE